MTLVKPPPLRQFKKIIWDHYRKERRDLSWRKTRDPYRILVSEIMLQQTQVARVETFYRNFIKQFPDFRALAAAKTSDVLRAWQGLGYNRRALNLRRTVQVITDEYGGRLPRDRKALEALPGIGKGTSGSLLAFAFNMPEVFIETNIRRVFIHFFFPDKKKVTDEELARYIESTLDRERPREWYWALMDYGSAMVRGAGHGMTAGAKRTTSVNPNHKSAHYKKQSTFKGSNRELRGNLLKLFLHKERILASSLPEALKEPKKRTQRILKALCQEGFLVRKGDYFRINT